MSRTVKLTQANDLIVDVTASFETGRYIVTMRSDNAFSDDIAITPAQARHVAAALVQYADVAERKQRKLKEQHK